MRSDRIKKGYERAPHRALLKATGVTDADMGKPFIAVCNSHVDIVPGHVHLQAFGRVVKEAVRAAGAVPFEFNTIGVDDGIASCDQDGECDGNGACRLYASGENITIRSTCRM